jgi:hypothetical protein
LDRRLNWGSALFLACITGWLEVLDNVNWGITFRRSPDETTRAGKYP